MSRTFDLALPWTPHVGQGAFLDAVARIKVLVCGRRWGKTDACAEDVVRRLERSDEPLRVLVVAPTMDQATILFDRILERARGRLSMANKPKRRPFPKWSVGPHEVWARSGHSIDTLRGHEATDIYVDEAAFVHPRLISDVLLPMLATVKPGRTCLISTANGLNFFYQLYEKAQAGVAGFWGRRAPSSENPLVTPEFLDLQRELVSERTFQVEYEAEFLEAAGAVFKSALLDRCLGVPEPVEGVDRFSIGIDWGRKQDHTALVIVWGTFDDARVVEARRISGVGYVEQCEILVPILKRYPNSIIRCDATGVGDSAMTILRDQLRGRGIDGVVFNRERHLALVDRLVGYVERGAVKLPANPELLREMRSFTWKHGRAEAAEGEHDDLVVALGLALTDLPREGRKPRVMRADRA